MRDALNIKETLPMPLLSVVMPVYNQASWLREALESLRAQTHTRLEILCGDDGSTDTSAAIIISAAQKDRRIKYIQLPHRGIVKTLNDLFAQAQGEYIARMDSDDRASPDRLEKQLSFLARNPEIDICFTQVSDLREDRPEEGYSRYLSWSNSLTAPHEIRNNRFI